MAEATEQLDRRRLELPVVRGGVERDERKRIGKAELPISRATISTFLTLPPFDRAVEAPVKRTLRRHERMFS